MKTKKFSFEKLFYNNKFVMVFSLLMAVALWTTVKVNFSSNSSRTISDIKVTLDSSLANVNDFVPFISDEDLHVDVNVTGKSYDISPSSLSKSSITVEAVSGYIDTAGYKVLNLTARSEDADVSITGIYPSTITVFYDREITDTFNVEAKIDNDLKALETENYVIGQPVASMNTVDVTGPATIVKSIKNVVFQAKLEESDLPLVATKEVVANLLYELDNKRGSQFLSCKSVDEKTNPASITIPVSAFKTVSTAVKFVNQPSYFQDNPPKVTIYPSKVKIAYNPLEKDAEDTLTVGTIDFRQLSNKYNQFTFKIDEANLVNVVDNTKQFNVSVNLSSYSKKTFSEIPTNVLILNQADGVDYSIDKTKGTIDEITIIGPKASLDKITVDDLQIEINVSKLNQGHGSKREIEVSNISIINKDFENCWIFGDYTAYVSAVKK